jgi:hypothetical protein
MPRTRLISTAFIVVTLCIPLTVHPREASWTPWLSRDTPGGSGDFETLSDFHKSGKVCENPIDIECRTRAGSDWREGGQRYICDEDRGGICKNKDQSHGRRCHDYEVRFLCPADETDQPTVRLGPEQLEVFEKFATLEDPIGTLKRETKRERSSIRRVMSQKYRITSASDGGADPMLRVAGTLSCSGSCSGSGDRGNACSMHGCEPKNGNCTAITCNIFCTASCTKTISVPTAFAKKIDAAADGRLLNHPRRDETPIH